MGMLLELIEKVAFSPDDESIYNGYRKGITGVFLTIPEIPCVRMEDFGYNSRAKQAQLMRNYYNPGEVEIAKARLFARRTAGFSSIAISTVGGEKHNSMGHCLRNIVVTQTPTRTEIGVFWKNTQVVQKKHGRLFFNPNHHKLIGPFT